MNMATDFVKGSFVLIASRPAIGKTALALGIADHLAKTSDKTILICSLELSKEQILFRLQKANDNRCLKYNNILICDEPVITVKKIYELCECTENLGAVIIDYLQLLRGEDDPTKAKTKQEKMNYISRALKVMARSLNIPVICTSQISKACEYRWRKDKQIMPVLADFADFGVLLQDADQIFLLYRDRFYNPETSVGDMAECIIAKNRYGDVGTVKLRWDPERVAFSMWDE